MEPKLRNYDSSCDVKVFLEKVSLHSSLKSHTWEKAAENIASKLEGKAFDEYMRLNAEDEKLTRESVIQGYYGGASYNWQALMLLWWKAATEKISWMLTVIQ